MAIEGSGPRHVPNQEPKDSGKVFDTYNAGKIHNDPIRDAAVGRALSHPAAALTPEQHRQITAAETHVIVERRLQEPTTFEERMALAKIQEGAEKQIVGNKILTPKERALRAIGITAATAAIVIPAGKAAYDSATQIPDLQAKRFLAESPIEVGPPQKVEIPIVDIEFEVPTFTVSPESREQRVAEAQEKLDDAWDNVGTNSAIAVTALGLGGAAGWGFVKHDPVAPTRRLRGRVTEAQGWRELGESKDALKKKYTSEAQD